MLAALGDPAGALSSLDAELAALVATVKMAVARGARYLRVHTDCPALVHRWQDRRGDDAMRHRDTPSLPVGKLPPEMLARLLVAAPLDDPRVLVGPGVGLDCAVIDLDEQLLVCKSDPVTFATDQLGDYLVQVNANDLATTGAIPSWLLVTLLLPENVELEQRTSDAPDRALARRLVGQVHEVLVRHRADDPGRDGSAVWVKRRFRDYDFRGRRGSASSCRPCLAGSRSGNLASALDRRALSAEPEGAVAILPSCSHRRAGVSLEAVRDRSVGFCAVTAWRPVVQAACA